MFRKNFKSIKRPTWGNCRGLKLKPPSIMFYISIASKNTVACFKVKTYMGFPTIASPSNKYFSYSLVGKGNGVYLWCKLRGYGLEKLCYGLCLLFVVKCVVSV